MAAKWEKPRVERATARSSTIFLLRVGKKSTSQRICLQRLSTHFGKRKVQAYR